MQEAVNKDLRREKDLNQNSSLSTAQFFKGFKLGGIGPKLNSDEYLLAKKKRQMMNLFSSQVQKTNINHHQELVTRNIKIMPIIHLKNKSYVDGVERRERMASYALSIKKPRVQKFTDFSAR